MKKLLRIVGGFIRKLGYKIQPDYWECMDIDCNHIDYAPDEGFPVTECEARECPKCKELCMVFKPER